MNARAPWTVLLLACVTAACVADDPKQTRKSTEEAAPVNAQLALTYLQQDNLPAAKEKVDKALKQDPKSAQVQMAAGFVYDRLGEDREAESHYALAAKYDPKNPDVLNNYAVFLCRKGDRKKGEQYFVQAAASPMYRTPEAAYANAGLCAREDGRLKDAEAYFRKALEYRPNLPVGLLQMAELTFADANYLQARAFLQRYFSVAAATPSTLWLGYRIESALGDSGQAQTYANRLKQEFPTSVETRDLLQLERGGS
jgi:type IV pilus assembly protein PilF